MYGRGRKRQVPGEKHSRTTRRAFSNYLPVKILWLPQDGTPPFPRVQPEINSPRAQSTDENTISQGENQWANGSFQSPYGLKRLWRDSLTILRLEAFISKTFFDTIQWAFILPSKCLPTTNQSKTHQRRLSRPFFIIMMIISSKNLSGSWGHVTSRPHNRTWGKEMESVFLDLHVLRATDRPLRQLQSQVIWRL